MKAVVVYESLWGNTAAVARAIADGIGPDARCLTTDAATPEALRDAALVVVGAPVIGFGLARQMMRENIRRDEANAPRPPDLSHPSLRSWLEDMPRADGRSAAFETRIWWSPRGATGDIERGLRDAGYRTIANAQKFIVKDKYGPLREGELERAYRWGKELAAAA